MRTVVGVMGSGRYANQGRALELGRMLASMGVHLLTGGGRGAMAAVSQGFHEVEEREGLVIGVLPSQAGDGLGRPPNGYPNPWVELAVRTHLVRGPEGTDLGSRNHINILSSDIVVALPGSGGTASEVALSLRYGKPVGAYLDSRNQIPDLPAEVPMLSSLDDVRSFVLEHR